MNFLENETKSINLDGIEEDFFSGKSDGYMLSSEFIYAVCNIGYQPERERIIALSKVIARKRGILKEFEGTIRTFENECSRLEKINAATTHNETKFTFEHISLDCGIWIANNTGIYRKGKDGNFICASPIPVLPSALLENINTGTERIKLDYFKGGKKRSLICDRHTTASSSKIVQLADKGLEVTSENAKELVRYISDCIVNNLDILPRYKAYSQLGWNNGYFVPYSTDAVFDGEEENKHLFGSVAEKGNFDRWVEHTHGLRKNLLVRLIMAASFASVLIEKVGALPFVFHLWGGTGTGKTVALMIAGSIWGNPALGSFTRSLNSTLNSMLSTASFLNNLPFLGDELQTVKQNTGNYDRLIMQLCEGVDRGRMDSNSKQKELKRWNCSFIFTGEEPCTRSNSGGGVKNRVIEVEITEPMFNAGQGNEIVNFIAENHGSAGKAFVKHITTQERRALSSELAEISRALQAEKDTTEKQASSMALMLLADKLACECIYKNETPLTVEQVAPFLISASEVDVAERAYRYIINCISINRNRFIGFDTNKENFGEFWGQYATNPKIVTIDKCRLEKCLSEEGFSFDAIKKEWKKRGYIQMTKQGRYYFNTTVGNMKAHYVRIVLSEAEDELPNNDSLDNYNDAVF